MRQKEKDRLVKDASKKLYVRAGHKNDIWFAVELPLDKTNKTYRTLIRKVFYDQAKCNAYVTTKNKGL